MIPPHSDFHRSRAFRGVHAQIYDGDEPELLHRGSGLMLKAWMIWLAAVERARYVQGRWSSFVPLLLVATYTKEAHQAHLEVREARLRAVRA